MIPQHRFVDQMGRVIELQDAPQKIVSLVPSQTELLSYLGLENRVAGITKFCVHPEHWYRTKTRIGGTKKVNFDRIQSITPDLIIANKEENLREDIERLEKDFPVWVSDITDLNHALKMIESVGEMTDTQPLAKRLVFDIKNQFKTIVPLNQNKTVAYLIWKNPMMFAGKNTFIDAMLAYCGLNNVFGPEEDRYPSLSLTELLDRNPDCIFLSSEPYPFSESDCREIAALFPEAKTKLVDGELFSWYGSRLKHTPPYLKGILNFVEIASNP